MPEVVRRRPRLLLWMGCSQRWRRSVLCPSSGVQRLSICIDTDIDMKPSLSCWLCVSMTALHYPTAEDQARISSVLTLRLGFPQGGAAQHVAAQLDQRIREHLKLRNNLFSEAAAGLVTSLNRPLLCLFDRNFELSVVSFACCQSGLGS